MVDDRRPTMDDGFYFFPQSVWLSVVLLIEGWVEFVIETNLAFPAVVYRLSSIVGRLSSIVQFSQHLFSNPKGRIRRWYAGIDGDLVKRGFDLLGGDAGVLGGAEVHG